MFLLSFHKALFDVFAYFLLQCGHHTINRGIVAMLQNHTKQSLGDRCLILRVLGVLSMDLHWDGF